MQVHSINNMSNLYSNRVSVPKQSNANTSFRGGLYLGGEFFLNASAQTLRAYAERLRNLPDNEIREITKEYGFLHIKRDVSKKAYEKLSAEIKAVQKEVDYLQKSSNPKDMEKLQKLYNEAEKGIKEYYSESSSYNGDSYHDSIDSIADEARSRYI